MRKVNREKDYFIRIRTRAVSVNFFWLENQNKTETMTRFPVNTNTFTCLADALMSLDLYPGDSA